MHSLPYDLVEDILRRLPVKSLKRFRAVERSWRSLIDSKSFVKLHLNWSLDTNSHRHLLLRGTGFFQIDLDNPDKVYAVKLPSEIEDKSIYMNSHPCNGLVIIEREPPVLWNPFTTEYKVLPRVYRDNDRIIVYGLAYDSLTDDYKVVRVGGRYMKGRRFNRAAVFGLKSNKWREIKEFPNVCVSELDVYVNGALHTLTDKKSDGYNVEILGFNVETEKHFELTVPKALMDDYLALSLYSVRGCLSIVYQCHDPYPTNIWWVMTEYGVMESWTKMFTIGYLDLNPCYLSMNLKPLVYSKDGHKVLLSCTSERLIWYGLGDKTMETVPIEGLPSYFRAKACVESLVSLNGDVGAVNGG